MVPDDTSKKVGAYAYMRACMCVCVCVCVHKFVLFMQILVLTMLTSGLLCLILAALLQLQVKI